MHARYALYGRLYGMDNTTQPKADGRRKAVRIRRYPVSLTVPMGADLRAAVMRAADADRLPATEIARQAMAAGLPLLADRRRKRGRRAGQAAESS